MTITDTFISDEIYRKKSFRTELSIHVGLQQLEASSWNAEQTCLTHYAFIYSTDDGKLIET
jgi:hypothetical protein